MDGRDKPGHDEWMRFKTAAKLAALPMTEIYKSREPEKITPAHLADVLEGLAQAKRGEFATDAEIEAAFRLFDL